jgi:site-specific DNA-methyltransferase (adenine-specific)
MHTNTPTSEVYNMDCLAAMREMPDKAFDLAIVDPPYGININMNMGRRKGQKKKHTNKGWDKSIPDKEYFDELMRVSVSQIVWGGNYFTDHIPVSSHWVYWDKCVPEALSFASGELAWTSFNGAMSCVRMQWSGNSRKIEKAEKQHPTQKPIALYKWLLSNYAKHGDRILDTHLGSGSSRIAAYDMGFDFVGYELDTEYFDAMNKRFAAHISRPAMFAPDEMYMIEQKKLFET